MTERSFVVAYLADYLRESLKDLGSSPDLDLLGVLYDHLLEIQEEVVSQVWPDILQTDPNCFEDPNLIVNQTYPGISLGPSKRSGSITFEDLWMRNPHNREQLERIKASCVGFAGFGGLEWAALILARAGVGHFILADGDTFESSNAGRQPLCNEDTLGQWKVEVGRDAILKFNSEARVDIYPEYVDESNVEAIFHPAEVIVEATAEISPRKIIHKYARRSQKPILALAGAGWEGQYLIFMPSDPLYYDVFDFARFIPRGTHPVWITLASVYVVGDVLKMLLGDFDHIVKYPLVLAINVQRTNPAVLRDIREIRARHRHPRTT